MGNTFLNYSPENHSLPRKGILCINTSLFLKPGINTLNTKEFNQIKKLNYFESFVEQNIFNVITTVDETEVTEEKKLKNLNKLGVQESLQLIVSELSTEVLQTWLDSETTKSKPRTTLVNALNKQIETIKQGNVAIE